MMEKGKLPIFHGFLLFILAYINITLAICEWEGEKEVTVNRYGAVSPQRYCKTLYQKE